MDPNAPAPASAPAADQTKAIADHLDDLDLDLDEPVNIFAAAEKGDVEGVDAALRAGTDVDTRAADTGATPLIAAAAAQQTEVVAHLLERGADPNAVKTNLDGALHWACYRGDAAVVDELLAYGADVNRPGVRE